MKKGTWILLIVVLLLFVMGCLYLVKMRSEEPMLTTPTAAPTEAPTETAAPTESETEPVSTEPPTEAPTELPTEPATEPPTEPEGPDHVQEYLDTMTLREKVLQMFLVTPEQLTGMGRVTAAGETTRDALIDLPVGGVIYFADNLEDRQQVTSMIENIQSFSKIGLFIAVDEEGGPVARVGNHPEMGTTAFGPMGNVETNEEAYAVGNTIGREIGELGFNLDFAPVADVNTNPMNPVIGSRAFSSDPEKAAQLVAACVEGFRDSGMLCTLKHFPGHGDTISDSHYGGAETGKNLEQLQECEFLPFAAGIEAGADCVMVGHISVPEVTGDDLPATLSKSIVTDLLQEQLQFEGLIITDSMQMGAISNHFSSGDAAVLAVRAGVDIILMPYDLNAALEGILEAVEAGQIPEERIDESVYRILSAKQQIGLLG